MGILFKQLKKVKEGLPDPLTGSVCTVRVCEVPAVPLCVPGLCLFCCPAEVHVVSGGVNICPVWFYAVVRSLPIILRCCRPCLVIVLCTNWRFLGQITYSSIMFYDSLTFINSILCSSLYILDLTSLLFVGTNVLVSFWCNGIVCTDVFCGKKECSVHF